MLQLKNSLVVCAIVLGTALGAQANTLPVDPGPCAANGTFNDLEHHNHGICTIGDKTFSDFTFTSFSSGHAHEVNASHLDYSIIKMGTAAIGFSFSGPINAGASQTNGVSIGYLVTGPGIIDARATISGTALRPTPGTGTITEDICPGGIALVGCSSPLSLHVVSPSGPKVATANFSPVDEVAVSKTVTAIGNFNITSFDQTFSQVPEPRTMVLFGSGLLLIGIVVRRKQVRAKAGNIGLIDVA
jgi:hypothetical protein